jgi:hypothetical protein
VLRVKCVSLLSITSLPNILRSNKCLELCVWSPGRVCIRFSCSTLSELERVDNFLSGSKIWHFTINEFSFFELQHMATQAVRELYYGEANRQVFFRNHIAIKSKSSPTNFYLF